MQPPTELFRIYLKSPAHLNLASNSMNFPVQAFYFAGEFGDRLQQAIIDVSLRDLLRRVAKKSFGG